MFTLYVYDLTFTLGGEFSRKTAKPLTAVQDYVSTLVNEKPLVFLWRPLDNSQLCSWRQKSDNYVGVGTALDQFVAAKADILNKIMILFKTLPKGFCA